MTTPYEPPERLNFAAHLIETNAARASKPAYIDDFETVTYGDLASRIRKFATILRDRGVRREQRILVAMLDTADLPVVFLGALYAGVVPVVVNTLLPAADFAYMMEHSDAQLVVTSGSLLGKMRDAVKATSEKTEIEVLISHTDESALTSHEQALATQMTAATEAAAPFDSYFDDIAFWLYSSGSTGRPKATVHSHGNLVWTVELYAKPVLGLRESDVVYSAAKIFFAYGLGNALSFPLSVGATTLLMAERPTVEAVFARLTGRHASTSQSPKPTVFCGVPTLYVAMLACATMPSRDNVDLRICTSAGEALPQQVGDQFSAHFGAHILDGIGSTEMLHIYLSNRPDDIAYGTTGKPVDGYQVELRDEASNPIPEGDVGDLYVKGPSAALMYWRDRTKTRATFLGPWMKTGDKYRKLPSGHFVYSGRSDDMIKVSGQYVSPVEVELVLQSHAAVLEAAVVGKMEEHGLQKTCAFVVLRANHAAGDALIIELQAFVKTKLAPHKYPREISFVSELPKTATGKIQRFRLRAAT